ncbi:MAG: transcription elongation factor GreA [Gaiellaceae bacterium]
MSHDSRRSIRISERRVVKGLDARDRSRYHARPRWQICHAFSLSQQEAPVKEVILTPEGYERLKDEIEYLSTTKRREVADRIRIAREFGDIAENAEYDDAKNEQAMLEHRIATLEERLRDARVIEEHEVRSDAVSIGTRVRLRDIEANRTVEYHIVGSAEANPAENRLSNESPVGRAILGRKKGETVEVTAPRGTLKFKILEIKAA